MVGQKYRVSSLEQTHNKRRTKREIFSGDIEAVEPWASPLSNPWLTVATFKSSQA